MDKLTMAKGRQVTIQDQELVRRREENKKYLLELDNENLLLPYTLEAGLYKTSELPSGIHGGWESPCVNFADIFWVTGFQQRPCILKPQGTGW